MQNLLKELQDKFGESEGFRIHNTILPSIMGDFGKMLNNAKVDAPVTEEYKLEDGTGAIVVKGKKSASGESQIKMHFTDGNENAHFTDEEKEGVDAEVADSAKDKATDSLMWQEVSTEHIVKDKWIDFRKSDYRFPDGTVKGPYYTLSRRNYVVIVARDIEGNYLCVRQFRQGINKVTTEFTAGGIEHDDDKEYGAMEDSAEGALEAAKRELLEETGYEADNWKHLLTIPANATIADNYAYLFLATGCKKVSDQSLDETEFLNVVKYSEDEIEDMIKSGEFEQIVHITAWFLALRAQG